MKKTRYCINDRINEANVYCAGVGVRFFQTIDYKMYIHE